jgi:DNA-3-methyladenine glycosylase
MGEVLPRSFYARPVLEVARDLLGMRLVRHLDGGRRLSGTIVEVEAYNGERDLACHASRGLTRRTKPLFGPPGYAYVYLVYGMHYCLNVVTNETGYPAAVLFRALEAEEGQGAMAPGRSGPALVASGPGRLTRAFHIGADLNEADLCKRGPLYLERAEPIPSRSVARGPRIGVDYAGAWARKLWRFGIRSHPALSRPFGRP